MKLHTILQSVPFIHLPDENPDIISITNDHRKVEPGSLFICVNGHVVDGHEFAKGAEENGAVAIVAEKPLDVSVPVIQVNDTKRILPILANQFYEHPTKQLHLIGITGTNGKTTTSHLLETIFRDAGRTTGLIGTINMKIGDRVIESKNTTPDGIVLQSIFQEMVRENVNTAIMEVSSHALVQGRVNGCEYDVAVFTNLSQDHLDYHQTMDEYRRAKGLLFSRQGNTYEANNPKFAILNNDDQASEHYKVDAAAHVMTYGINNQADFHAADITLTNSGTSFTLTSPEGVQKVQLKLMGTFNIYNALASIAAAYVSNIPLDSIIRSLENVTGVPGRFEPVDGGQDFPVIVDYAHTPDSLENVLKTIKQFAKKRIFAIVGCGGDRDKTKRPLMAEIACMYATNPIFTSDNPRSEDPLAILADMEKGAKGQYQIISDRKEAIKQAIQMASGDDVILIAGKGHETYQIIGEHVFDFDDRLVALEALKGR
ncbi:UDP-N-acetylmuramoyl-L-alanyl-D-glutamate--2,6-diaminopimelate ligase [Bacillus sp. FJAT-50079]|uniref:UDP-N-acetylmuramoyl-L-alanyl-D-glutamate--2, 6-diaminopimelate ligase n=1 Tax=Bacillus sp. FJAT-50079 TaxID=2833577 RepID=UPI001BCA5838|nr:UDP-N-acetylmuramoyl-L-alanyl-D-glutamate--2,6-diaminopimelate ligase [Bacillus sp. FJAT-50079]MBS4207715.1 UDP-N-acetylmuramoyl-L-alanyl-D-glutamate--2,6-diaminopimelate ligase [Bacillus sp. FJAT-50079]